MMYFKIVIDNRIIGIINDDDFRLYQTKHNTILYSDIDHAQFVEFNDTYYHDDWLRPIQTNTITCVQASIVRIEEQEFNELVEIFGTREERDAATVEEIEEIYVEEEPVVDTQEEYDLSYIKEKKLKELNNECKRCIEAGFDIQLSDNQMHHFSLTVEDQLNLITLSTMLESGVQQIPYHADGELCKYYSIVDMSNIIAQATAFKTYHTTYVNALKSYVESLDTIESVSSIEYGSQCPVEYQSVVLTDIIAQQGVSNA